MFFRLGLMQRGGRNTAFFMPESPVNIGKLKIIQKNIKKVLHV